MSESPTTEATAATDAVDTGRYLYCFVDLTEREPGESAVDLAGIEDEPVSLVTGQRGSLGALVHARNEPFDSTDLTKLRDWLLAHQQVVDAAGDQFGTPLPVRFDTVIEGDDEDVAAWLDGHANQITDAFGEVSGCWEYRVTLSWDSTEFEAEQQALDPELSEIQHRIEQSGDGTAFLLEKQFDQRLRELRRQRETTLEESLVEQLRSHSEQLTERPIQSDAAASLGIELDSDAVAQIALLATPESESALGSALDEMTETPGVDVRFTGPWPPYTFAPQISDDE
jgi:arsenate reductase-like glutaredoxin family protein